MKRLLLFLLPLLVVVGCQISPPSPPPPSPAPEPVVPVLTWSERLQQQVLTLPGAQVTNNAGRITIAYPQESLFSAGAVLPFAGGTEVLDPLVALLRAYPEARWDATVRAITASGADYDLSLAQKRRELLQRYLHNGGVDDERVSWQAQSGDGNPLELTLRPLQPVVESSSGVKE